MHCNANAMQCDAKQSNAMQYNAMQFNTMQCKAMLSDAMQCDAMLCLAMVHSALLRGHLGDPPGNPALWAGLSSKRNERPRDSALGNPDLGELMKLSGQVLCTHM